jgi:ankyrin repeat protein
MLLKALLFCLPLILTLNSVGAGQTGNQPNDFELALQAIKERNVLELRTLLEKNRILIEQKDVRFGATLLHWAVVERDVEIIRLLIDSKASRVATNKEKATPLMLAVVPNPNATLDPKWNNKEVIGLLANMEVIDLPNAVGKTALHLAAEYGDEEVVQLLLEIGASPIAKTSLMKEPWQYATNERIKKILRDKAMARHAEIFKSLLHKYAERGDLHQLKLLVQSAGNKFDLNGRNANQETALIIAAKNSHFEVVAYLIKMNADVSLKDATERNVWAHLCPRQVR